MTEIHYPDFLGIGTPKSGTSWLHDLLESHPRVFIPTQLKEIHFFDRRFGDGREWYANFFREATPEHSIVGDITPHYLYTDPHRITEFPSIKKLILMYRDPVDRVVSHFKFRVRLDNYGGSLNDFLVDYPQVVDYSRYGKHFASYLRVFDRSQFLVLRLEDATSNVEETKSLLCQFLGLDAQKFPETSGSSVINPAFNPRNRVLYKAAVRAARWMGDKGLYGLRNWIKQSWFAKHIILQDGGQFDVRISPKTIERLREELSEDYLYFQTLIAGDKAAENTGPSARTVDYELHEGITV